MLEHISELSDTAAINLMAVPHKGVKFRESLIQKNDHNRRENMPSDCRTPSILKRSRMLREKTYQNLQVQKNILRATSLVAKPVGSKGRVLLGMMIGRREQ